MAQGEFGRRRRRYCPFLVQLCNDITPRPATTYGFLLGGERQATCLVRSAALTERLAQIVFIIERKIFAPSALPSRESEARSGCGIKPKTFRSRLQIPAMFSIEPFGFASETTWPWVSV